MKTTAAALPTVLLLAATLTACASSTDVREHSRAALPGSGTSTGAIAPGPSESMALSTPSSEAASNSSATAVPSLTSGQRLALIKGLTAIDPNFSTIPNQMADHAQALCGRIKAGVTGSDLVEATRREFTLDTQMPSPQIATKIAAVVRRTVCP